MNLNRQVPHNIKVGKRIGELFQSNEIEDEIHFICKCHFVNIKHTAFSIVSLKYLMSLNEILNDAEIIVL